MVAPAPSSPISRVRRSGIGQTVTIALFARAAGRCEFDGCNELLIEHHVTKKTGNYGEKAHIVAYEPAGPRGASARPADIHALENLMLLCPTCHKEVDSHPDKYSVETLRVYKNAHEDRIRRLTALDKNHQTKVVIVKARIGGDIVTIPRGDVYDAIAPFYPDDSHFFEIDLTQLDVSGDTFYDAAQQIIRNRLGRLLEQELMPQRIALFALAPIPVLIFLGNILTNKVTVDFFQRHRDTGAWAWKAEGAPAVYTWRCVQGGTDRSQVAIILSLSGTIDRSTLPAEIDTSFAVYEMGLEGQEPTPTFLNTKADLGAFQTRYREAIAAIVREHGLIEEVAVFPAVPVPVAVACGHELLPKVHPALNVYDYDKRKGGFRYALTVNGDRSS
jgi:SMODS-associated and fused to various effectors sensor domain/HNH endonuclease